MYALDSIYIVAIAKQILYANNCEIEEKTKKYHQIIFLMKTEFNRIYLRLMKQNNWIDEKKFKVLLHLLSETGKINGGLIKFYGKNYKKSV